MDDEPTDGRLDRRRGGQRLRDALLPRSIDALSSPEAGPEESFDNIVRFVGARRLSRAQ